MWHEIARADQGFDAEYQISLEWKRAPRVRQKMIFVKLFACERAICAPNGQLNYEYLIEISLRFDGQT